MKSKFIEEEIRYTGKELSPHWIYKNFNLIGDSIIGFTGECEVKLDNMVDISDVLSNSPIYSKKMLHFIVEHFNISLIEGILRQRLLVNIARDVILDNLPKSTVISRQGDDLFYNKSKLSVSIATKSITSVLIHLGINIDAIGAPVEACGLKSDFNLENIEEIANNIIKNYCRENEEIMKASCKVRGVI
ncbi:MAG: hypothetical protein A2255_02475 [Candidatus Melainabacteria bacterium RIFOXYA2_FULL_32_9]|nr:MAG: hypothetical protein A2255_02475 [Candidatus Melainabacteria bacterium RIFOXYA2_FULL_32_9]